MKTLDTNHIEDINSIPLIGHKSDSAYKRSIRIEEASVQRSPSEMCDCWEECLGLILTIVYKESKFRYTMSNRTSFHNRLSTWDTSQFYEND